VSVRRLLLHALRVRLCLSGIFPLQSFRRSSRLRAFPLPILRMECPNDFWSATAWKHPDAGFQRINDRLLAAGPDDFLHLFEDETGRVSEVAERIVELADGTRTNEQIVDALCREFDVAPERCRADTASFIRLLMGSSLPRWTGAISSRLAFQSTSRRWLRTPPAAPSRSRMRSSSFARMVPLTFRLDPALSLTVPEWSSPERLSHLAPTCCESR